LIAGKDSRIPPVNPAVFKSAAGGKSSKNPAPPFPSMGKGGGRVKIRLRSPRAPAREGGIFFYELINLGTKKLLFFQSSA
jgi:hypothetical protein